MLLIYQNMFSSGRDIKYNFVELKMAKILDVFEPIRVGLAMADITNVSSQEQPFFVAILHFR